MDDRLKQDALIEEMLRSQPLAPLPRTITAEVIKRVQHDSRPAILTWSDVLLSFVIAACIAALWFAAQYLPPMVLARFRIQGILLYQELLVNASWIVPAALFGLAALLAGLTIPFLIQSWKNATESR